jgi:hypothetical protein
MLGFAEKKTPFWLQINDFPNLSGLGFFLGGKVGKSSLSSRISLSFPFPFVSRPLHLAIFPLSFPLAKKSVKRDLS